MDDNTGTVLAYFIFFGLPVLSIAAVKMTRLIVDRRDNAPPADQERGEVP